jgi:hypothetical protein
MIHGALNHTIGYNTSLAIKEGVFMSNYENINGFQIIEDLGKDEKRVWRVKVICKACNKPFVTTYYSLHRIKGCGCNRPKKLAPLPEFINGFKTIKCHGYNKEKGVRWATVECKECKRVYDVDPNKLQYRKHCGCMKKGTIATKYKKSHPQLAQAILHMKSRCYNKNNQDYYNYGARGITVCDEWLHDSNKFCEWSLANGFESNKGLSIDRIDSSKGYFPENCRWTNATEQSRNTRRTKLTWETASQLRIDSKTMNYDELANKYNVSKSTVWAVIAYKVWREP